MIEMIYFALILYFIQHMLPSSIAVIRKEVSAGFLLSPRDNPPEFSVYVLRARRALDNLQASLIVFLALAVLAIVIDVDVSELAVIWLIARIAYLFVYVVHIPLARTATWLVSIGALVAMALALS